MTRAVPIALCVLLAAGCRVGPSVDARPGATPASAPAAPPAPSGGAAVSGPGGCTSQ